MLLKAYMVQALLWQSSKEATKYLYYSSRCDLVGTEKCQYFTKLYI